MRIFNWGVHVCVCCWGEVGREVALYSQFLRPPLSVFFLGPPPSLVDVRQTIAFFLGTIFSSEQPHETFLRFLG